jgi:hypothetical protein
MTGIPEGPGLKLGWDTDYPGRFFVVLRGKYLDNALNIITNTSTSFLIHYLIFSHSTQKNYVFWFTLSTIK